MITVNRIREGLVSACSVEMLSAHDVCVCVFIRLGIVNLNNVKVT